MPVLVAHAHALRDTLTTPRWKLLSKGQIIVAFVLVLDESMIPRFCCCVVVQVAYQPASVEASIHVYQEAVDRNPNDVMSQISVGLALLRQDRLSEALSHLSKAVEVRAMHWLVYLLYWPA